MISFEKILTFDIWRFVKLKLNIVANEFAELSSHIYPDCDELEI
jgi:hypothetical protein